MSAMPAECKPLTGHGEHGLIEERGMDVRQYGIFKTFVGIFICRGHDPDCGRRGVVSVVLWRTEGLYRGNAGADFGYGKGDGVR